MDNHFIEEDDKFSYLENMIEYVKSKEGEDIIGIYVVRKSLIIQDYKFFIYLGLGLGLGLLRKLLSVACFSPR